MQYDPIILTDDTWTNVSAQLVPGTAYYMQNKDIRDVLVFEGAAAPESDAPAMLLAPQQTVNIHPSGAVWMRSLSGRAILSLVDAATFAAPGGSGGGSGESGDCANRDLSNVDNDVFLAKGIAAGLNNTDGDYANTNLSNVDNDVFLAKGIASGLNNTDVSSADVLDDNGLDVIPQSQRNREYESGIAAKQDTITAGPNISLNGSVIAAYGGAPGDYVGIPVFEGAVPDALYTKVIFSTVYGCAMYWDEALGFYRSLRPVDVSLSMRLPAALAPGEYVADGTKYLLTSKQGKVLQALPAALKTAWRVTVSGTQISSPSMLHSDGRYFYPRFGVKPGVVTTDAIRNITGTYSPYANDHGAIVKGYPNENACVSGAFTRGTALPLAPGHSSNTEGYKLAFDASLVVPTANENRVLTATFTPVLWLGV